MEDDGPLDARNAALKAEIESRPDWPQTKQRIELERGVGPISPADLNSGSPADKDEARNAVLKAAFESGNPMELTAAEMQVQQSLRQEMGDHQYEEFHTDASTGLASMFKTQEAMEAFVLQSGILDDPEDLKEGYRLLAKRGAKLRASSRR